MKPVNVRVRWLIDRRPLAGRYATLCAFPDTPFVNGESWSMVLDFSEGASTHTGLIEAKAWFLVPDAPWETLQPGNHFEMFEGRLKTAWVEVVEAP